MYALDRGIAKTLLSNNCNHIDIVFGMVMLLHAKKNVAYSWVHVQENSTCSYSFREADNESHTIRVTRRYYSIKVSYCCTS